jgi:hypothetical protein
MTNKNRLQVLMLSVFAGAAFMPAYATAQEAQQNERLQRQIDALQQQLETLQKQVSETKKTAQKASQDASQASATAGAYAADLPARGKPPAKAPWIAPGGVKITAGGFIEAAGIWRNKNEAADVGSDFNNIPYSISPLGHEQETRFSARQSRLWVNAEGNISTSQIIKAYFEMDFLGAATTSNSIESNSYTPRIRQAFVNYDDTALGWHITAGQAWSLLTQNRSGIVAGKENIPLTIDAQYVVGFNWTRNAQIRVVKDFGPTVSFGVSAESPQVRFQSPGSTTPSGLVINSTETGTQSGLMDTLQSYSTDTIPDFIEKFAFDPGWGHYEVFGLQRFFTDNVQTCTAGFTAATCVAGGSALVGSTASNLTTFGWGVGGSALLPAIPKFLDLQASVLYGDGIGRYGSGQLPDVTFGRDGSLSPVTALQTMVGAVAHFTPNLDVYSYAGLERDNANFSTVAGNAIGLGNPAYLDGLCFGENNVAAPAVPTSPVSGVLSNTGCSVNVKQLEEITVGFWQNFYKGDMGRLAGGMQFEYIHRTTFPGAVFAGGPLVSPPVDEAIVMTSLRYYFP